MRRLAALLVLAAVLTGCGGSVNAAPAGASWDWSASPVPRWVCIQAAPGDPMAQCADSIPD